MMKFSLNKRKQRNNGSGGGMLLKEPNRAVREHDASSTSSDDSSMGTESTGSAFPLYSHMLDFDDFQTKITVQKNVTKTPDIFEACRQGNIAAVRDAIADSPTLVNKKQDGRTPLFYAAYNGFSDIVKVLLDAGAKDFEGTAYTYALGGRCRELLKPRPPPRTPTGILRPSKYGPQYGPQSYQSGASYHHPQQQLQEHQQNQHQEEPLAHLQSLFPDLGGSKTWVAFSNNNKQNPFTFQQDTSWPSFRDERATSPLSEPSHSPPKAFPEEFDFEDDTEAPDPDEFIDVSDEDSDSASGVSSDELGDEEPSELEEEDEPSELEEEEPSELEEEEPSELEGEEPSELEKSGDQEQSSEQEPSIRYKLCALADFGVGMVSDLYLSPQPTFDEGDAEINRHNDINNDGELDIFEGNDFDQGEDMAGAALDTQQTSPIKEEEKSETTTPAAKQTEQYGEVPTTSLWKRALRLRRKRIIDRKVKNRAVVLPGLGVVGTKTLPSTAVKQNEEDGKQPDSTSEKVGTPDSIEPPSEGDIEVRLPIQSESKSRSSWKKCFGRKKEAEDDQEEDGAFHLAYDPKEAPGKNRCFGRKTADGQGAGAESTEDHRHQTLAAPPSRTNRELDWEDYDGTKLSPSKERFKRMSSVRSSAPIKSIEGACRRSHLARKAVEKKLQFWKKKHSSRGEGENDTPEDAEDSTEVEVSMDDYFQIVGQRGRKGAALEEASEYDSNSSFCTDDLNSYSSDDGSNSYEERTDGSDSDSADDEEAGADEGIGNTDRELDEKVCILSEKYSDNDEEDSWTDTEDEQGLSCDEVDQADPYSCTEDGNGSDSDSDSGNESDSEESVNSDHSDYDGYLERERELGFWGSFTEEVSELVKMHNLVG